MKKEYWINGTQLASAREAMAAHREGKEVVAWYHNSHTVTIKGMAQAKKTRLDENTARCKHIADELDEYVNGNVRRCPECGEEISRGDWDYECFKCPECGAVSDPGDWEQLSVWDFLSDCYDVEFRVTGKNANDLRSVKIMVAYGGPNIYLDTASGCVDLYWWTERASWHMSMDGIDALNDWAEEYWGCK